MNLVNGVSFIVHKIKGAASSNFVFYQVGQSLPDLIVARMPYQDWHCLRVNIAASNSHQYYGEK